MGSGRGTSGPGSPRRAFQKNQRTKNTKLGSQFRYGREHWQVEGALHVLWFFYALIKIFDEESHSEPPKRAKEKAYPFPYLFDETQATAKAYGAMVTPHVYLLDGKGILRYRGRVNDKKDQAEVKSNDLMNALDAMLAGKTVEMAETKAFGCSIKWKKAS